MHCVPRRRQPQADLTTAGSATADDDFYYPRDLEASFCRDFSCCGLILSDLHDLLQHYEECHVRFEEDEAPGDIPEDCFFADEWPGDLQFGLSLEQQLMLDSTASSTATTSPVLSGAPKLRSARPTPPLSPSETAASSVINSPLESAMPYPADTLASRKRSADASSGDRPPALKRQATRESSPTDASSAKGLSGSVLGLYDDDIIAAIASATDPLFLSSVAAAAKGCTPNDSGLSHDAFSSTSLAEAANAAVVAVSGEDSDDDIHLPPSVTAAMAGAVAAAAAAKAHGLLPRDDKPYRCPVQGCDKAYKNPNGLKYHNLHGHCSLGEDMQNVSKPYKCRVPECYKAYKNLNGLKYHVQHAHCAMIPSLRDLPPNATPAEVAAAVAAAAAAAAATAAASAPPSPAVSAPASPTRGPIGSSPLPHSRAPPRAPPHSAGPAGSRLAGSRPVGSLPRMTSAPSTPVRATANGMPPHRPQLVHRNSVSGPPRPAAATAHMPPRRPLPQTQTRTIPGRSTPGAPIPRPRMTPSASASSVVRRPLSGSPVSTGPRQQPQQQQPQRQQPPQAAAATC
ncbi:Transcriptional regulator of ribosomal biogenesis proteins [Coemansia guatemalensis]|uniref:Transcriptional regulator of ribosomal biogenesis proteins n=1 Tax=Coemansia guatemalensis TaxID=2761395 RepID=A0A9W8LSN7_9FUNG|nr:Transcriptional regulator of ribosomal biogenesis proteins [Coemansia guatemalensis]